MYSFDSRVRYSEVNSEKELTLPALIDYLQDCCTFQSEELGVGVDYLKEKHCAWVLSAWEIIINDYPKLAEQIEVGTWAYGFRGFYGYRNFCIKDSQGKQRVIANSIWVFMDTDTMHPMKITDDMVSAYLPGDPALAYEWSDRKIRIAGEGKKEEPVRVQRYHIDTNHHMNNGKYVELAEEYLPEEFKVGRIRVEYRKAAVLGDLLHPVVLTEQDRVTVVLMDEEEKTYAAVQFLRSKE